MITEKQIKERMLGMEDQTCLLLWVCLIIRHPINFI